MSPTAYKRIVEDVTKLMSQNPNEQAMIISPRLDVRDALMDTARELGIEWDCTEPVADGGAFVFQVLSYAIIKED